MAKAVLAPVGRKSLVDSVVEDLTRRILRGDMPAGEALPAEQELAAGLGVSRTAVREALNRLAAARLVSIRHSGAKHVLDYRASAGLEILPLLLLASDGHVNADVVRAVVEMRSALAPDIARLAARRARAPVHARLWAVVRAMEAAGDDLVQLQDLAGDFWSHLVDGADNLAYRLAYNSLRSIYDRSKALFTQVLAGEIGDAPAYGRLVAAVVGGDPAAAEAIARELVRRGERSITAALRTVARKGGA
jgi:DNA-binding FadR family transcriptional regulator